MCDQHDGAVDLILQSAEQMAHTAGKLVRIHPVYAFLVGNADHLQHLDRTCLDVILCHIRIVKCNDLIHLLADTKYRI